MKHLMLGVLCVSFLLTLPITCIAGDFGDIKITGYDVEANASQTLVSLKELLWIRKNESVGIYNVFSSCEPGRTRSVIENCITHSNLSIDEVLFRISIRNILDRKTEKKLIALTEEAPTEEPTATIGRKSWTFRFTKIEFAMKDPDFHFTMTKEGLIRLTASIEGKATVERPARRLRVRLKKVRLAGIDLTKAVVALLKIVDLPQNFRMDGNDLVVESL